MVQNDNLVVVLDRPQHPANIGAVVRALRNFGFMRLRLVNPAPFARTELLRYAHRCEEIVGNMTIHTTLGDALADVIYVVGTAAQAHPGRPHTTDVRRLAQEMRGRSRDGLTALLFGTEGDGLDRHALDRCHIIASLPTVTDYPALNLAQSVLLFLYEIHQPVHQAQTPRQGAMHAPPATQADLERLFVAGETLLTQIGHIRYNPESLMRTLRQMAYRAQLSHRDVAVLMGIIRRLLRTVPPGNDT